MTVGPKVQKLLVDELCRQGGWVDGRLLAEAIGMTRSNLQTVVNDLRMTNQPKGWTIHCRKITRYSEYRIARSIDWYAALFVRSPPPMHLPYDMLDT